MATRRRIERLRDVVARIELLPVSPERDRLLREVRSRAVDIDTGITPRAMLPMREPAPDPVLRRPPSTRMPPPPPAAPVLRDASAEQLEEPLWVDGRMSLEDSLQLAPPARVPARGERPVPTWTHGLRE